MTIPLNLDQQQASELALRLCNVGTCDYSLPPAVQLHVSPDWAKLLDYQLQDIPPADQFHDWWEQQIHPHDRSRIISLFNKLYAGEIHKLGCSFRIKNHTGEWLEVEVFASAIQRDKAGRAQHIFSVMRDVSNADNRYKRIVET